MTEQPKTETLSVTSCALIDRVKQRINESNGRRVVIKQGDTTIAEFPLTVGVVSAVFAPVLAAIGAVAALATNCMIEVEQVTSDVS
jgi:hypothetical protein